MKGLRYLGSLKTAMHLMAIGVYSQVRHEWLGQRLPSKPSVIQFPINDICNAKCVMCNIGLRKRDREISTDELRQILRDPLFAEVRYVGISGGEPTLRADLAEIGQVLVESLPKLKGTGMITNAVRAEMVMERTMALSEVMKKEKIPFGVNVSLDGIGEDHDKNRGVAGNFESAEKVIRGLKEAGLPVSIGCTLTPINCYDADDVLMWCEKNEIRNYEFRIAVDIKRLYNEGFTRKHPFTDQQRFHVMMFFDKLSTYPGVDSIHQQFYTSLVSQLAFGSKRTAGCDWRTRGVTLDSRGNISYCSVESAILGSALEQSAADIFTHGLSERRRILQEHCDSCQHDLLGPPPPRKLIQDSFLAIVSPFQKRIRGLSRPDFRVREKMNPARENRPERWNHVLITGWYGTETAGDKAILGELVNFLKTRSPACRITLTSLDLKVSLQTQREMKELAELDLMDLKQESSLSLVQGVDAVIVGGGPLEEIQETQYIWRMFVEANKHNKARILFGCGVGPVYTKQLREMVESVCRMATGGFLRDEESRQYALDMSGVSFQVACDPALAYFRRWFLQNRDANPGDSLIKLVALLRANTTEYLPDMPLEKLKSSNEDCARQIARILQDFSESNDVRVNLLPMHSIPVGGDDRIFNRTVAGFFKNGDRVYLEKRYLSLSQLLESILAADVALTMRYHGHLICMAFGIPLLSVDYTGESGKVSSLIRRIGYEQFSEKWNEIDSTRIHSNLQRLLQERQAWSSYLQKQTDHLLDELNKVYITGFENAPVVS